MGLAITDAKRIAGEARDLRNRTCAVVRDPGGRLFDLNAILPKNSGWTLQRADGTPAHDTVVGDGRLNDRPTRFRLQVAFGGACLSDINQDGSVDTSDLFMFVEAWLAGDRLADINADGAAKRRSPSPLTHPRTAERSPRRDCPNVHNTPRDGGGLASREPQAAQERASPRRGAVAPWH